jgi:hypothetical protein
VSAPTLDFPAHSGVLQYGGTTVDGTSYPVNPPLVSSTARD